MSPSPSSMSIVRSTLCTRPSARSLCNGQRVTPLYLVQGITILSTRASRGTCAMGAPRFAARGRSELILQAQAPRLAPARRCAHASVDPCTSACLCIVCFHASALHPRICDASACLSLGASSCGTTSTFKPLYTCMQGLPLRPIGTPPTRRLADPAGQWLLPTS